MSRARSKLWVILRVTSRPTTTRYHLLRYGLIRRVPTHTIHKKNNNKSNIMSMSCHHGSLPTTIPTQYPPHIQNTKYFHMKMHRDPPTTTLDTSCNRRVAFDNIHSSRGTKLLKVASPTISYHPMPPLLLVTSNTIHQQQMWSLPGYWQGLSSYGPWQPVKVTSPTTRLIQLLVVRGVYRCLQISPPLRSKEYNPCLMYCHTTFHSECHQSK